jgi:hypothetical protein
MEKNKNRILLETIMRMKYDTRKTLSENLKVIEEQVNVSPVITPNVKSPNMIGKDETNPSFQIDDTIGCKYIERAISRSELPNKEYGIPSGYCAYNAPPQVKGGSNTVLLLPKPTNQQEWDGLKITFFNDETNYEYIAKYWLNKYYKDKFGGDNPEKDEKYSEDYKVMFNKLVDYLPKTLPKDTVRSFSLGDNQFVLHVQSDDKLGYPLDFTFYDYKSKKDGKSWFSIQPKLHDERSGFGKFMDKYEGWLMFGQLVLFIGSLFTGAGEFAVVLEIINLIANTGLPIAMGIRALQKGENISAGVWTVFLLLPYTKYFKTLKVDMKVFNSLVEKLKNSNLGTKPSLQELKNFYKTLTLSEQETFTTIITDKQLLKEFKSLAEGGNFNTVILEEMAKNLKNNPTLKKYLTSPSFWNTLAGKEVLISTDTLFVEYVLKHFWEHELNNEEKNKLESVYWVVGNDWKNEFIYNLGEDKENIENNLSCLEETISDKRKKFDDEDVKNMAQIMISHCYLKNGHAYFNFGGPQKVEENKDTLKSIGYVEESTFDKSKPIYDTVEYDGIKYVFPK